MASKAEAEALRAKLRKHSVEEEKKPPKKSAFGKFKAKREAIKEEKSPPFTPDDEEETGEKMLNKLSEQTEEEKVVIKEGKKLTVSEKKEKAPTALSDVVTTTTVNVQRMYKDGMVVEKDEQEEDLIKVRVSHPSAPMAKVGWSSRMTINMGDYNSAQIGVDVILPCYMEELGEAFDAAKRMVELRVNREIAELRDYREKKGS